MYSWSQPGLWWLAVAYTVKLASSNWWEKECYIASRVAAHLLMRHSERQFVAPLHQSPLSILCIYGCIVRMCLRWSSFKAKHKAHFLVRMRHSPCPTTHTHTHISKPHPQSCRRRYLPEGDKSSFGTHLYCVVVAGFIVRILACGGKTGRFQLHIQNFENVRNRLRQLSFS